MKKPEAEFAVMVEVPKRM
jgi:hypothetical protein